MYKHEKRLTDASDDSIIWRYMSFTSFYSLLFKKSLFFRRLDKYTDQLEGTLPIATVNDLRKHRAAFEYSTTAEINRWTDKEITTIEGYKAHTLASSWSLSESENYSMWKIYLYGQTEGVAVTTTVSVFGIAWIRTETFRCIWAR
jgi:hypothetical protein